MAQAGRFRSMKNAPTVWGTFCMVSTEVKMVVKPMISMMEEEETRVFFSASPTPFQVQPPVHKEAHDHVEYSTAPPALGGGA